MKAMTHGGPGGLAETRAVRCIGRGYNPSVVLFRPHIRGRREDVRTDRQARAAIEKVREFWNAHPLWVGDGQAAGAPGTKEFFESSHGAPAWPTPADGMDPRFYPVRDGAILDLGCGIGYWLEDFGERGYRDLTGADISQRSLDLAALRCRLFGIPAKFSLQNAQGAHLRRRQLRPRPVDGRYPPFGPIRRRRFARSTASCRPGGRAVVSVYYKNFVLRHWSAAEQPGLGGRRGRIQP